MPAGFISCGLFTKKEDELSMNKTKDLAKSRARSTAIAATVFLAPAIILIFIYMVYPVVDTFITSGYKWNGISADRVFVGIENWKTLIKDEKFWAAFGHNLIVTFLDAGGKKLNIFKIIWFFPYLMSSVAIAFLFNYILATNGGLFSSIATLINGKKTLIDLLGQSPQALFAVIGVMAWQFTPFYMVYFIAGYSNIDSSLYEAAVIDGATRKQYLFKIAIPLLGPIFKTACTMSLIGSLKYFDMIWNMTGGGPAGGTELMATYMYKLSFQQFNMGYGSAVAAGMFILITLIALLFQKIFVVKEDY